MLLINHHDRGVPRPINNYDNVIIGLCVISHESFQIWFWKTHALDCLIKLCPHDLLIFDVFRLHVKYCNGHHFAIGKIVRMTSHSFQPTTHFTWSNMIQTFCKSLHKLHLCDKACSTPHTIYWHLENENLLS